MRILLVQPKMTRRPMDSGLKSKMSPSLALLTLKALTPAEYTVVVLNENVRRVNFAQAADLVAITVTVDVLPQASVIAAEYRRRGVPVVAGGIHISADPDSAAGLFDSVCLGRAEATWPALLADLAAGQLKPRYVDNLADREIRPPDHGAPDRAYIYPNILAASRGCPYQCDFCYNSAPGSTPFIPRPIDDVVREVRALGRRHVLFVDDNFIGNPRRTGELLNAMLPLNIKWSAAVSANVVDYPDLLDLMVASGCQSLFIGFETLNQAAITAVHKRQNHTDRYADVVEQLHRRGIMVNASIVFGLDEDDESVFERTLTWMKAHRVETVTAHILTPYPGTALHRTLADAGRIVDTDLAHYDTAHVVFSPAKMTMRQLQFGYERFYRDFYSWRSILARLPHDTARRRAYLFFAIAYRKFGRITEFISHLIPLKTMGWFAAKVSYGL
ncbi:MAG: B12-binding domain-containing radical SAM protein [Propionibacteriaceae bacterium]|nr:B12-binding domain-containing radical SAM protein [Propionibacteriaceae bacterium]